MKKFTFPLDRVMEWRRAQARIEEIKLAALQSERRGLDARELALNRELGDSKRALIVRKAATGFELAALGAYQRFADAERVRIATARADCSRRIAVQLEVSNGKRRDVRLLEDLKERRLKSWQADLGREIDRQANETFLAKWVV